MNELDPGFVRRNRDLYSARRAQSMLNDTTETWLARAWTRGPGPQLWASDCGAPEITSP